MVYLPFISSTAMVDYDYFNDVIYHSSAVRVSALHAQGLQFNSWCFQVGLGIKPGKRLPVSVDNTLCQMDQWSESVKRQPAMFLCNATVNIKARKRIDASSLIPATSD